MSVPRKDLNFTVADLKKAADKFHAAGKAYWEAAHKAGIDGAVVWLTMDDGSLLIFTRGEYEHVLMKNIHEVGGPSISFGATAEK